MILSPGPLFVSLEAEPNRFDSVLLNLGVNHIVGDSGPRLTYRIIGESWFSIL